MLYRAFFATLAALILAGSASTALAQPSVGEGVAAYLAGEYKKALDVLELPAKLGNAEAQYLMGEMREQGLGIAASRERALFWYGQAAAQGHIAARAALEAIRGIAATGNLARPLTGNVLLPGASSGTRTGSNTSAPVSDAERLQAMLNGSVPFGPARARQWAEALQPRAENGDADSAALLGQYYESTLPGPPDYVAAVRWYRKAAELKHPLATNNLGALHYEGRGVPRDPVEALRLYRIAAETGYAIAQYNLGLMLGQGRGVEADVPQMIDWIKKAALQSYPRAQAQLARLYLEGAGVEKDVAEAVRLFRAAAEGGNANAQYWYGRLINTGEGVTRDLSIGADWILKAAEAGMPIAMHEAGALWEQGLGRPANNARALDWYRRAGSAGVKDAAARLASAYANGELGLRANSQEAGRWSALAR
jgi:uncharacterized protein